VFCKEHHKYLSGDSLMKKAAFPVLLSLIIAGAFLAGSVFHQHTFAGESSTAARKILYYVDPMHPAYRSANPGTAPDCGMRLEPVYAGDAMAAAGGSRDESSRPPNAVNLSVEKQQRIGVKVSAVEKMSGTHSLRLFARVAPDETKIYKLTAGMDGVMSKISGVTTGSQVSKDQWLATFSAPELRAPIQGYMSTLDVIDRQREGGANAPAQISAADEGSRQALDRLLNMGISLVQVEEVKRTRVTPTELVVTAPAAGIVLARNVAAGQRFDKGLEWFRIADISRVWILADVFEQDAKYIRPGQVARVTLAAGGAVMSAKVSDILPQFDPSSRTFKVRLEMDNPGFALRPDMFVDVALAIALPPSVAVPVEAVLDSGLKKTVFVDRGEGYFEPRQVETGWRFDDRIQIVRGLEPGERIVTSANFLLDSETRMQQAAAAAKPDMAAAAAKPEVSATAAKAEGKDPVCGMGLTATTQYAAEYGGEHFHFCSDRCQHKFEKDPGAYLHKSAAGVSPSAPRGKS
jgi:Cu(I)/Ag(I) efflux system membrane fusion protein